MDLHFLPPDLRRLDEAPSEVLVTCLFSDEHAPQGVTGLVNWRLAGRVDQLLESGFLTGKKGEVLMLPGRPRLRSDKVLLFGLGSKTEFDEEVFDEVTNSILKTLVGLCVRSSLVQLPGRHTEALPPERAADRFLAAAAAGFGEFFDAFTLLEVGQAQKRITQHMIEERRRVRKW